MTVSVASHPVTKQRGSDFAALSKRIKSAGLLERRHGFYAWRMSVTVSLFAAGWVALAVLGHSWWSVAVAAYLAIVSTQLGFLGHDAGHHQIFRTRKPNDVVGLVNANLLTGLSYGWWVTKHNRHHKNPNHEGMDPDISPGALAFTGEDTRARSRGLSSTAKAARIARASSSWTAKTSASSRSYCSVQIVCPERASMSRAAINARSPDTRTLPSTTLPTPSSLAMRGSRSGASRYGAMAPRLSTRSAESRERCPVISSVIPAAK